MVFIEEVGLGQSGGGVLRQNVVNPSKPSSLEGHGAGPSHCVHLGVYYPICESKEQEF